MRPTTLLCIAIAVPLLQLSGTGQCLTQELVGSDTESGDRLGAAVDTDGVVAIVGADQEDAGGSNAGAAYVFRRTTTSGSTTWAEDGKLVAPDPDGNDHFGQSVAIDGVLAVVGSPDDDDDGSRSGSAHVYRYNGSVWAHEQKLTAGDAAASDRFGWSVGVEGGTIVVGAKFDDDTIGDSGSAYVFEQVGTTWTQVQKITAPDPANLAQFGDALALRGDLLVVGAWQDDDAGFFTGSAYVFRDGVGGFTFEQKLTASDLDDFRWFGRSVDVDGDAVVVGAYGDEDNGSEAGAAYVFRYSGTWTEEQKLTASDGVANDRFGWAVGIDGPRIVVGAYQHGATGVAYRFEESGGAWSETGTYEPDDAARGQFGRALAYDGGYPIAGAYLHDHVGSGSGSAYAFSDGTACDCPPASYCTAGTTTNGCTATMSGVGVASASAGSGFTIECNGVEGQKSGILFYGVNGPTASVWGMGGTSFLCVKAPSQRTGAQNSGGTAGACDGQLTLDWNAYIAANPGAQGNPFAGGETVWAQGWFRDPPAVKTTSLSDGLVFDVCP